MRGRLCIVCGWSALQRQSWVVKTQTLWPAKPKLFNTWSMTGMFVDSTLRSSITLFSKANKHFPFLIVLDLHSIWHRCPVLKSFLLPWGQCVWNNQDARYSRSNLLSLPDQPVSVFHSVVNIPASTPVGTGIPEMESHYTCQSLTVLT